MRVLFLQNGEQDGPGLFAKVLAERGVMLEVIHAWRGELVPATANACAGIAIGGGSMSAYEADEFPFLSREIDLLRVARASGTPVFGMCLGAQLMAAAFGGKVFANHMKEIGFFHVRFTPAADGDRLWRGHTATFRPVHWHGDTFTLPPGATLLASSEITPHQLFRLDDTLYGAQFHLEIDLPVLRAMIAPDDGGLPKFGIDPREFLETAETALPLVEPIARDVFTRWSELLR